MAGLAYYALIWYSKAIMRFLVKLSITLVVIIFCSEIGKKFPSLGGLIATMPLTGLIVLVWLYSDNPQDYDLMVKYTRGALWGILPSIFFFLVALICFRKHLSFLVVLLTSFGFWSIGAFFHLLLLG